MDEDAVDSDGEESEVQLDVLLKDMEQDDDPAGENSDEDDIIAIEDQGGLGEEAKQHDASDGAEEHGSDEEQEETGVGTEHWANRMSLIVMENKRILGME